MNAKQNGQNGTLARPTTDNGQRGVGLPADCPQGVASSRDRQDRQECLFLLSEARMSVTVEHNANTPKEVIASLEKIAAIG